MVFLVVMYRCESQTIKQAEPRRIDAFELWCQRRLLRVPWTARRSNHSILKEISLEYSLEGLMLKVKSESEVAQSCLTLRNPMNCSPPGSSIHGISQARVLEWVAIAFSTFPMSQFFSNESVLFQWISSSHQVAKVLTLQLQLQSFQWIFRTDFLYDWLVWPPCSPRDSQESSPTPQFKSINSSALSLLHSPTLTSIHDHWKNHSLD